jgi:transcriptional regulator with XRE-family HTH domain
MIGTQILAWRTALGWSQERLAQTAGISQSWLSDVETGKRTNLQTATLDRIAGAMGLKLIDMLCQQPQPQPTEAAPAA